MLCYRVASNPSTLANNPNGNPSQYYTGVASNPNIGILATPLAVSASPWQPKEKMLATPLNMVNSKLRNSYSAY